MSVHKDPSENRLTTTCWEAGGGPNIYPGDGLQIHMAGVPIHISVATGSKQSPSQELGTRPSECLWPRSAMAGPEC